MIVALRRWGASVTAAAFGGGPGVRWRPWRSVAALAFGIDTARGHWPGPAGRSPCSPSLGGRHWTARLAGRRLLHGPDCSALLDEIGKESGAGKYTFAEMEEGEQDLEKLVRWLAKIQARDFFPDERGQQSVALLARCRSGVESFSRAVYAAEGVTGPGAREHGQPRGGGRTGRRRSGDSGG